MPTIHISSAPLPVPRRRAVAVRLTRWLTDREVPAAHVVVRFTEDPPNTVFSGGMPVDALPGGEGLRHAAVICCLGPDRDEEFRGAFAEEIANTLGAPERTPFLYIEFRPTPLSHVHLAAEGRLARADLVASRRNRS